MEGDFEGIWDLFDKSSDGFRGGGGGGGEKLENIWTKKKKQKSTLLADK